jgi:prenylcysteine alpha-carboxyl methylesterase
MTELDQQQLQSQGASHSHRPQRAKTEISRLQPKDVRYGRAMSAHGRLVGDIAKKGHLSPIHPSLGLVGTLSRLLSLYIRLQYYVAFPGKWVTQFLRLVAFVILMLPGLLPPFFSYIASSKIRKNIAYGSTSFRQQLDVYLPHSRKGKAPVVIFVSGGAWIIGYKAWGYMMGQVFQKQGVLFIAVDYRNFPEATVSGMVEDVKLAINWILQNLEALGGDPENVTLMGQSAGAHLSGMALLEHAQDEAARVAKGEEMVSGDWSVRNLSRWIGISGPYDIVQVMPTMKKRGLPRRVIKSLMGHDLTRFSPTRRVRDLTVADPFRVLALLPPVHLFHGTSDETVSWQESEQLASVLTKGAVPTQTKYYENKSHTDPILEDPCDGDRDELMGDLLALVKPGESIEDDNAVAGLQPKLLLRWARFCNPF